MISLTKNKQEKLQRNEILAYLQDSGFFLDSSGQRNYFKVEGKVVRPVLIAEIRRYLLDTLYDPKIREEFLQKHYFLNDKFLDFLKIFEEPFLRDTKSEAYYPFRNGIVKVTIEKIELVSFESVEPYIREEQIIQKVYTEEDPFASVFYRFIQNIAGRTSEDRNSNQVDTQKVKSLMSLIGYMLINYKDKAKSVAPILMDESISNTAEGGRGKTLIGQAISKLRKAVFLVVV